MVGSVLAGEVLANLKVRTAEALHAVFVIDSKCNTPEDVASLSARRRTIHPGPHPAQSERKLGDESRSSLLHFRKLPAILMLAFQVWPRLPSRGTHARSSKTGQHRRARSPADAALTRPRQHGSSTSASSARLAHCGDCGICPGPAVAAWRDGQLGDTGWAGCRCIRR